MKMEEKLAVKKPSLLKRFVKRSFDLVSSGLAIVILLPFFLLFTPLVAIAMKGNPFFIQKRPGKDGKIFKMIKYRTMTNAKDADGNLLPDSQRLTKFGRILRATSIDELPELFNIFIGDMSVVGPRPLAVSYLPYFNEKEKIRFWVRPGLTGLAQVHGRSNLDWEKRFAYDIEYVENMSFFFDLKVILETVKKVFYREGTTEFDEITLPNFHEYRRIQWLNDREKKEIGSDFWEEIVEDVPNYYFDRFPNLQYALSGRTALAEIAEALLAEGMNQIALPAYCCDSMVDPFVKKGISIEYYPVVYDRQSCSFMTNLHNIQAKAVLYCNFFGLSRDRAQSDFVFLKEKQKIIVYDITHTVFLEDELVFESDYYLASLRKWLPITDGAIFGSPTRSLSAPTVAAQEFYACKRKAMTEKLCYMVDERDSKTHLPLFRQAEQILERDYIGKSISDRAKAIIKRYDIQQMSERRRANRDILIDALKNIPGISFVEIGESIFVVPIVFSSQEIRNNFLEYMKAKDIYLPVHWIRDNVVTEEAKDISERIISLVIDQRYQEKEMCKVADVIIAFAKERL